MYSINLPILISYGINNNNMSVIKGYTIQGILAKGGMATIYIAQQESLKRQVALKVLNPKLDTVILDHFLDESRIIASLKHPNIIPVYDVGRVGIHFYHAMEYLEGGDLEARIAQKQIDVHTALEIILELSDALYLVHSKGIMVPVRTAAMAGCVFIFIYEAPL